MPLGPPGIAHPVWPNSIAFCFCRNLYGLADTHSAEKQFRNQRFRPHARTSAWHLPGNFACMHKIMPITAKLSHN